MVDLDAAIELLEKVKLQVTRSLNGGKSPICGNCKHWDNEAPNGSRRAHGVCSSIMANCKTYNKLLTISDFGCIYHEPQE